MPQYPKAFPVALFRDVMVQWLEMKFEEAAAATRHHQDHNHLLSVQMYGEAQAFAEAAKFFREIEFKDA